MRYAVVLFAACSGSPDGGGSPDAPLPANAGYTYISHNGFASAGFFVGPGYCPASQRIGPCEVFQCTRTAPPAASAGAITISGASQPITLMPSVDKTYQTMNAPKPLFTGGELVTFAAAGADVPAFSKSLTMPSQIMITSPTKPSSSMIINRAQDFTVLWSGGGTGILEIGLVTTSSEEAVFCRFDASASTGTIPSTALQLLPAGAGTFSMTSIAEAKHVVGDWLVDVEGYFNAVWSDASDALGGATFQ